MKVVQLAEAKAKFSELIRDVERGEIIEVTRNGKPVARIAAPEVDDGERRRRAVEELRAWRRTLPLTTITVADILAARDEGRKP